MINNIEGIIKKCEKFKILAILQSEQRTIRFPNNLIEKVENYIKETDEKFSYFVKKVVIMALND